jgi:hypothetical protein
VDGEKDEGGGDGRGRGRERGGGERKKERVRRHVEFSKPKRFLSYSKEELNIDSLEPCLSGSNIINQAGERE